MHPSAVTVAIYLNNQWPIVTRDPLVMLKYKYNHNTIINNNNNNNNNFKKYIIKNKNIINPYISYINTNKSNIICYDGNNTNYKKTDKYCDSADFYLSEEVFIELIIKALNIHDLYCDSLMR